VYVYVSVSGGKEERGNGELNRRCRIYSTKDRTKTADEHLSLSIEGACLKAKQLADGHLG
jgi:hypothetical protein